jgi:phytoene dehydrogenase-like protein
MPPGTDRVVVIGAGHNGLVCACYLARAGLDVLVLEQADRPGGGSRTEATVPGAPEFRFDTHSVAHNMINMTTIPAELHLDSAGLDYIEMDPFAAGFFADGRVVRFYRDVDRTVASIAEHDPAEGAAYAAFVRRCLPLVDLAVSGIEPSATAGRGRAALRAVRRFGGPWGLAHDLVAPYGTLLATQLGSELTRAPIASFAAHSSAGPHAPGGSFYAMWQAAYHRHGQWHARGGAGGLTSALVARLESYGGSVRTGAGVRRIVTGGDRVRGVELYVGERIPAAAVVAAIDPTVSLLGLLDPPLGGLAGRQLAAAHRGNAVQMLVHLAVDRLPAYRGAQPGDHNGLQSHVETVEDLRRGFLAAEAGRLPDPPPTYAFTTSAVDDSLAPAGRHTVYLACPCTPYVVEGGWPAQRDGFAAAMVASMERQAPGFSSTVLGMAIRTPEDMARELHWPGAHPMHLDISLDQLAFLRPTRRLSDHTTPVQGLFISGSGTAPVGGVSGAPGKAAARALLLARRHR